MKLASLDDLFELELKDLYSAEHQLLKALPKIAKASADSSLQKGFEHHLQETKGHVERLERIFEEIGKSPGGHTCEAMKGLIEEGSEIIEMDGETAVKDAALISAAQRVEHYEISAYGAAHIHAELLGRKEAARLLKETLEEEKATDRKLTEAAKKINDKALAVTH
jgi:ferritin-like metal-binding protein YciE